MDRIDGGRKGSTPSSASDAARRPPGGARTDIWFEDLPTAALVVDASGRIEAANHAARRLLDIDGPDDAPSVLADLVDDADSATLDVRLRRLAEEQAGSSWELRLRGDGVTPTHVRVDGVALGDGDSPTFLLALRDVASQRARQAQLLLYQRQLRSLAARLMRSAEQERRRVARDLHDGVGGVLSVLELKTATLSATDLAPSQSALVADIGGLLEDVSRALSTMVFRLSPPVLRQVGLAAAIRWLGEQLQEDHGLLVQLRVDDVPDLPQELRGFLFRAVRELLHNCAKHAQTDAVHVALKGRGRWLDIEVSDEGCGFDRAEGDFSLDGREGFGLFSLREEISYLGGSFELDTRRGVGTRVRLTVPLEENDR